MKHTPQITAIYKLLGASYHAALLNSEGKPLDVALRVIESIKEIAISLLSNDDQHHHDIIQRICAEDKLKILLSVDSSDPLVQKTFGQLDKMGFSSETQLVTCTIQYCNWLRKRRKDDAVNRIMEKAVLFVHDNNHKNELLDYIADKNVGN